MVLKKVTRNPAMEGVDLFRRLDAGRSDVVLTDPERARPVVATIEESLRDALAQPTTVQGWRTQAMFASLVAALDVCDLMTSIDMGDIYYDGEAVKAPDFFLHLRDGRRLLVDVKHHIIDPDNIDSPIKFSRSEIARLTRYAELLGGELHLAIYLSGFDEWALLTVDDLNRGSGGGYRITPSDAIARNRMVVLGDVLVGTLPQLAVTLTPDPSEPHPVGPNGDVEVTVGAMRYFVGDQEITEPMEQRLVAFMTYFGKWPVQESATVANGNLTEVRWQASPDDITEGQGFEIVGHLSTMYSRMFESGTTSESGITNLDPFIQPGTLASLLPHDFTPRQLPLWRISQHPRPSGP